MTAENNTVEQPETAAVSDELPAVIRRRERGQKPVPAQTAAAGFDITPDPLEVEPVLILDPPAEEQPSVVEPVAPPQLPDHEGERALRALFPANTITTVNGKPDANAADALISDKYLGGFKETANLLSALGIVTNATIQLASCPPIAHLYLADTKTENSEVTGIAVCSYLVNGPTINVTADTITTSENMSAATAYDMTMTAAAIMAARGQTTLKVRNEGSAMDKALLVLSAQAAGLTVTNIDALGIDQATMEKARTDLAALKKPTPADLIITAREVAIAHTMANNPGTDETAAEAFVSLLGNRASLGPDEIETTDQTPDIGTQSTESVLAGGNNDLDFTGSATEETADGDFTVKPGDNGDFTVVEEPAETAPAPAPEEEVAASASVDEDALRRAGDEVFGPTSGVEEGLDLGFTKSAIAPDLLEAAVAKKFVVEALADAGIKLEFYEAVRGGAVNRKISRESKLTDIFHGLTQNQASVIIACMLKEGVLVNKFDPANEEIDGEIVSISSKELFQKIEAGLVVSSKPPRPA